jgi:hypothetical protein
MAILQYFFKGSSELFMALISFKKRKKMLPQDKYLF